MKSINKTLDVLELFLESKETNLRLLEVARQVGINKSAANRIVSTLTKRDYLQQSGKRGKYSLGPKFIKYGQKMNSRMRQGLVNRRHLIKLNQEVGDCVIVTALDGYEAVITEKVESEHTLRMSPMAGSMVQMYCTAQGKAILAYMSEAELDDYLKNVPLKKRTETTITTAAKLRAHLLEVAAENAAYEDEENFPGARNVAVAIRDANGRVLASVGVLAPSVRFSMDKMKEVVPYVQKCALAISKDFGYTGKF